MIIFIIVIISARFLVIASESKKNKEIDESEQNGEEKSIPEKIKKALRDVSKDAKGDLKVIAEVITEVINIESEKPKPQPQAEKRDIVGIITGVGGFAISLLGVGLVPLILFPLLDYSAYTTVATDRANITITVKNIGFTSAKNVIVSIHGDNAIFSDLVSHPYLSEQFKKDINSTGEAYAKLTALPPRAEVKITGVINPSSTNDDVVLTPYVLSEEGVGKINRLWTLIFYSLLTALYSIVISYLYFVTKITKLKIYHVAISLVVVTLFVIAYFIIYEFTAIIPTYPQASPSIGF